MRSPWVIAHFVHLGVFAKTATKMALIVLFLLCTFAGAFGQVFVGTLDTLAHNVGGDLWIADSQTFHIVDISYDGRGPDAFFYTYTSEFVGDKTADELEIGGGVIVSEQFETGVVFLGDTNRTLTLPPYVRACDIGNLGVWCRYAQSLFTLIEIPQSLFTTDPDNTNTSLIFCEPSPGVYVGDIRPMPNNAISGTLYIVDDSNAILDGFTFDVASETSDVFVYYFPNGFPANGAGTDGFQFTLGGTNGALIDMDYVDAVVTLPFPAGSFSCDMANGMLAVLSGGEILGYLNVPIEITVAPVVVPYFVWTNNPRVQNYYGGAILCDRPSTRPGVLVGQLEAFNQVTFDDHRFNTDTTVYAVDNDTLFLQLFNYDGSGFDTTLRYWPRGATVQNDGNGGTNLYVAPNQATFEVGRGSSFSFASVYVNLEDTPGFDRYLCDIGTLTVWGKDVDEEDAPTSVFAQIEIPESIFSANYAEAVADPNLIFCRTAGAPPTVAVVTLVTLLAFVLSALVFQA